MKWLYKWTIGLVVNLFKKVKKQVKELGWFWGLLATLISAIIFYLPSIIALVLYSITMKDMYWIFASGYVVWWFLPMFSPALLMYFTILSFVIVIINKIKKKDKVKEIVIEEKEVKNYGRKEKNI